MKPLFTLTTEDLRSKRNKQVKLLVSVKYMLLTLLLFCPLLTFNSQGQNSNFIDININSGNPAFPFPQFLEYKEGKSLAKYNAEGVTHADMEKTMREAYEIMSHRARYSGEEVRGVRYVSYNSEKLSAEEVNHSESPKCSEGDGYFLLAAAIYADQPTFNGVWMMIHDYKIPKVKKYSDGKILYEDYPYSPGLALCYTSDQKIEGEKIGPHGRYPNEGSALDGDDDIAMALLIAYKQWGDTMKQNGVPVLDFDGNPISYRQIAKDYLSAFVDTFSYVLDGFGHGSGNIGIDGYIHGGNKGGDMTQWRATQTDYPGISQTAMGSGDAWFDYAAPAYYNEFAKWLEEDNVKNPDPKNAWRIQQYKRGEASCDWLMGEAYKQGLIPSIAKFYFNSGNDLDVTFANDGKAEDFRLAWRTIMNYVWHGNPETTWNPKTHQVEAGGNTFEYDMAIRFAEFLKEAPAAGETPNGRSDSGTKCVAVGMSPDHGQPYWSGVCNIQLQYDRFGGIGIAGPVNFTVGTGSPSAVAYGDLEFLGDMYRESELRWDGNDCGITANSPKRYEESTPLYFHGWFRNLGLLVNSGNYHAPSTMVSAPNMKVYMSVDKTYCYVDDKVEYTVQFRNYGSKDATDVVIETSLDPNYEVVEITRGKDKATITQGKNIIWNIGKVAGFKTGELDATIDSVSFVVVAKDTLNPRICLTSTVSTTDENNKFEDWTSNEYPNHATATMERNCVDILPSRTLQIKKTASRKVLNPDNIVKFTIEFENKSLGEASWLNGGRDNVRLSYANYLAGDNAYTFIQGYRLWHSASEAYINTGNYRCSYFMYDAAAIGVYDPVENPTGWGVFDDGQSADRKKYGLNNGDDTIKFSYQRVPYYEDSLTGRKCNQRLITQFPNSMMSASSWIFQKIATDNGGGEGSGSGFCYIHKGISGPFFLRNGLRVKAGKNDMVIGKKFFDDWSYQKLHVPTEDPSTMQGSPLYLLTPCYANHDNLGYTVDKHGREVCDIKGVVGSYDRILVEEFDGYTWRRILGNAPRPGREAVNVTIIDTIPYELEFFGWIDSTALKDEKENKIQATYTPAPVGNKEYSGIIKWTSPVMLVGEKDKLVYSCIARDFGCSNDPQPEDIVYKNVAWISSQTDSPDSSQVFLTTTCSEIPDVIDEQKSLYKRTDMTAADVGESVPYSVTYVNNTGTHVEADCSTTTGWISLNGSASPKIEEGNILMHSESKHMFGPEYSYGNNGDVFVSLDRCDIDAVTNTWVVLRYNKNCKAVPGDPGFEGIAIQLIPHASGSRLFKCVIYDNGKEVPLGEFDDDLMTYRGDVNNPVFKIKLVDDKLYLYINDEEDDWSSPVKTVKGLKAKGPGYFGMYVSGQTNARPHLTKFITDLDYAFNVTLSDQLPVELGKISDIKLTGTNLSETGTWDESKNVITWPTVAKTVETAIAPGDSVVGTFDAEVVECVDKYITNMGLATVYGLDTLKVLNTINCGSSCELESAEITLNDCECDSAHIGVETNAPGSYYYTLYKGDEKVAKSTKNSFSVAEEGKYHVVVTSTNDDQCMASTSEVYVGITKTPVGEDFIIGPICAGTKAVDNQKFSDAVSALKAFEEQNVRVLWFDAAGDPLTEMPNPDVLEAGSYEFTYWLSRSCCAGEPYQFTFTKADTAVVKLSDLTICAGQSGTLSVDKVAGYSYLWSDGSTENELVTDQEGTYKVTVTTADGCLSTAQASIKVEDKLVVDLGKDTTICSANLPLVLDASSSYDTYLWNDNSTGSTLEVTESGEYEVAVTQGSCDGGGKITVTVAESPVLEGTFDVSYMLSDTAANGQFDKSLTEYDASVLKKDPNFTYVWFDKDSKELSSEPIPSVITDGTPEIFYVKAVNGNCESELQKIKVQVISSPMPKAEDVNYCLNDEAQPLTAEAMDDGSGAVWTLTWYDADGNVLADAPKPSTAVAGETLYYVTQKDQNDVEGAKRKVTVTVYALPEVEAIEPIKKSCEEKILLNPLFTEKTGVAKYYMHYFDPEGENMYGMYNCIDCTEDVWATYSGTYNAWVYYYPITGLRCGSADKASIEVAIDTLKEFKVTASPSVCPFGEVEFSASASAGDAAVEYQWSGDAIGNEATLKVKDVDGIYGTTYSYKLNVIAGECQKDTTLTLTVGRGELTGALSANGQETKEYRTCGGEDIILSTTHEGSDFKWSTLDGTLLEESQTVTVTPSANTTYVLSFVNKCETSDTIKVEVLPISLTTDFSLLNTSVCEGEKASGTLTITGYDETMSGSYIKWFKDGVELPAFAGKSELSIESATTADAGTYTYEVSNGICLAKTTAGDEQAKLEVKPFVSFSMPDKVLAANGSSASLSLSDLIPSDAQVSWQGTVNSGSGNPFEIAEVTTSELFDIKVTADGYCERDTQLQLLVDAKVIVSASTTTPVVCQGDYVTLIADTTGTGLLLNPSDYKVTWYVAEEGGEFTSMQTSQLEIKNAPDTNVSYFAVVTYGDQVANSDTVPVTILSPLSYTKTVDTVSCSGAEIALNVTIDDDHGNAYEIKWEDGTTGSDLNVTPTVATDYAFTITQMDGLCPMTDKVHVSVKENPSIEMEDDVMICSGSSVTLDPTVSGDDIDSYAWVGPDGDTLDTSKKLTLEDASTGEYKLIVTSASCGSASASQNVTVIPTPEVTIDSINFVTRRIVATGSSSSYEYKVDNGAWNTVDTFQSYIFDIPHTAFVRDDHGCEGLTLFTIIAPPVPIPEYFVPGSGSEHDSWDLTPIMDAYPTSTVKIYDRTGKVVAELDGDTADWDGTYNGHPLPSTDYWYVLNVPEIRKQFTGHFTLIRSK